MAKVIETMEEFLISYWSLAKGFRLVFVISLTFCALRTSFCDNTDTSVVNVTEQGQDIMTSFFTRYNATNEIDLVFVLDRSGSVPTKGWDAMLNFVQDVLQHFTVDKDNTRVAIVTYSNIATVDINDLEPNIQSDLENKCTLNRRIQDYINPKIPYGYTATYDALVLAKEILLKSRATSKKAIFVVTDGKSNIGQPPVRVAHEILSLQWNQEWDSERLGPQVEIYAFGITNATVTEELKSIASDLPDHVFLIPNFRMFEELARFLHGDLQEDGWTSVGLDHCPEYCNANHSVCSCGNKKGSYSCGCDEGYEMIGFTCRECRKGYYKDTTSPISCTKCAVNMTTRMTGATSEQHCRLLPGLTKCPALPDIQNGIQFYVTGTGRNEVYNTNTSCDRVKDGNSCHYACVEGYRLTSSPVMICNDSGLWEGEIPTCDIIDCHTFDALYWTIPHGTVEYLNSTTTYGSLVEVTCYPQYAPMGYTTWSCDRHGRWTRPDNFLCEKVYCAPVEMKEFLTVSPKSCATDLQDLGANCSFQCPTGFNLSGPSYQICSYDAYSRYEPLENPSCVDTESPVIECLPDLDIQVSTKGDQFALLHDFLSHQPKISDNSGKYSIEISNTPDENKFAIGHTQVKYTAFDKAGNEAVCLRMVHIRGKDVDIKNCPKDITKQVRSIHGKELVSWKDPVFLGTADEVLEFECSFTNNAEYAPNDYNVICYPKLYPDVHCGFTISVTKPPCKIPNEDKPPSHGDLICAASYVWPRVCNIECNQGYEMRSRRKEDFYRCEWDGKWTIDTNEVWPSCSRANRARRTSNKAKFAFGYDGPCEENKAQIEAGFRVSMQTIFADNHHLCEDPLKCELSDVTVICGDNTRRRRNIAKFPRRRIRRADGTSTTTLEDFVRFEIAVTYEGKSKREITKTDQDDMIYAIDDYFTAIDDEIESNNITFTVNNNEVTTANKTLDVFDPVFDITCEPGEIEIFDSEISHRCFSCPPGTYLEDNNSDDCTPCPLGTYQNSMAATGCKHCPYGKNTTHPGSNGFGDCKAPCSSGQFSETGYAECSPCPKGMFQNYRASTSCIQCPRNTSTLRHGAEHETDCIDTCEENMFSKTGLVPCTRCPWGWFANGKENTKCEQCLRVMYNENPLCPVEVPCPADSHCSGNGLCFRHNEETKCVCHQDFTGSNCQRAIEEDACVANQCQNNATCVPSSDSFTYQCLCRYGYSGNHCEFNRQKCSQKPCQHGNCIEHGDSFICYCHGGWNGTLCDTRVNRCDPNPCVHGTCIETEDDYECSCLPGFTGKTCHLLVDNCVEGYCQNNGLCEIGETGVTCSCLPGFTGSLCEVRINYCNFMKCQNKGMCISTQYTGYCKCKTGYRGNFCEEAIPIAFDLVYPVPSITNYVLMPPQYFHEPTYAISACLWLRTDDSSSYGTIMSYAAESNWGSTADVDVFTIYDYGSIQIFVNGESSSPTEIALNTGEWHHLCVTWESKGGEWQVYVNGTIWVTGSRLAHDTFLEPNGYLAIGQRQGSIGNNFDSRQSFVGELSQMYIFNRKLEKSEIEYLGNRTTCVSSYGELMSWTDITTHVYGDIDVRGNTQCLDVNECLYPKAHHCKSPQVCSDQIGGYECINCDRHTRDLVCRDVYNPCLRNPCKHGGQCLKVGEVDFRCNCPMSYTGNLCEIKLNQCAKRNCKVDEVCLDREGTYFCACVDGPRGEQCRGRSHSCSPNPCKNNGVCEIYPSGKATCTCTYPWTGPECNVLHLQSCANNPCLNNGTCVTGTSNSSQYTCECPETLDEDSMYGDNCEILTRCETSEPCLNGGTCIHTVDSEYGCVCKDQFTGSNCETDLRTTLYLPTSTRQTVSTVPSTPQGAGVCSTVSCYNGGTCFTESDGFQCKCTLEYKGQYCETQRPKSLRKFHATVGLDTPYRSDKQFKAFFTKEIHSIYAPHTQESKLLVRIKDIREGSTIVDFDLVQTVFLDSSYEGSAKMKEILEDQLEKGKLGPYPVSMKYFKFNKVEEGEVKTAEFGEAWKISVVAVVCVIIIIIAIVVSVVFCRRKQRRQNKRKSGEFPDVVSFRVNNNIGASPTVNLGDDPVYAEPYATTSSLELSRTQNGATKCGKHIKSDWIFRQSLPLPPKPGEEDISIPLEKIPIPPSSDLDVSITVTCEASASLKSSPSFSMRHTPPPSYRDAIAKSGTLEKYDNQNTLSLNRSAGKKSRSVTPEPVKYKNVAKVGDKTKLLMKDEDGSDSSANTNASFEEDAYLIPRSQKIDSDHESDDDCIIDPSKMITNQQYLTTDTLRESDQPMYENSPRSTMSRQDNSPRSTLDRQGISPLSTLNRLENSPRSTLNRQDKSPRSTLDRQETPKISIQSSLNTDSNSEPAECRDLIQLVDYDTPKVPCRPVNITDNLKTSPSPDVNTHTCDNGVPPQNIDAGATYKNVDITTDKSKPCVAIDKTNDINTTSGDGDVTKPAEENECDYLALEAATTPTPEAKPGGDYSLYAIR